MCNPMPNWVLDVADVREADAAVEVVGVWIGSHPDVLSMRLARSIRSEHRAANANDVHRANIARLDDR
jgi:hypothetical protein